MHLPLASVPLNMRFVVPILEDNLAPDRMEAQVRRATCNSALFFAGIQASARAIQTRPGGAKMPQMKVPKVRTRVAGR